MAGAAAPGGWCGTRPGPFDQPRSLLKGSVDEGVIHRSNLSVHLSVALSDPRSMTTLIDTLRPLAERGLILPVHAARAGVDPRALRRAVDAGELTRVRRGVFAVSAEWNGLTPAARHRALVEGTNLALRGDRIFSHYSAAAMHRLPILGPWPSRVEEVRPRRTGGRSTAGVVKHDGPVEPSQIVQGVRVTSVPRTLLDLASTATFLSIVVSVDAALHIDKRTRSSMVTVTDLQRELDGRAASPGHAARARVVTFGNGSSDSPGESLSRGMMHQLGFPAPELQCVFRDRQGRMIVDFWWPEWNLIGEFDGLVKYNRASQFSSQSAVDVVIAEKRREDRLRATASRPRVARWVWDEALRGQPLAAILRDAGLPQARQAR